MLKNNAVKSDKSNEEESSCNIWLISDRLHSDFNSSKILKGIIADKVIEYKISDLAKYMLNPNSIEVTNKLVGCKISYQKPVSSKIKDKTRKFFEKIFKKNRGDVNADFYEETLISDYINKTPDMKDTSFQSHINKIRGLLTPYDTLVEKISELDFTKLHDIAGIFDDPEGNRSLVHLKGTMPQKINYISNNIQKKIGVILKKVYLNNGLFEMRGFDFESYDSEKSFRLVIITQNDKSEACVLTPSGNIEFHVENIELIKYLHFLQLSLKTNGKLKNLLYECVKGEVKPLKLLFNKELEIDYFKTDLPEIYREVFEANNITPNAKDIIIRALNRKQIGILINYLPKAQQGNSRPITSVYVMHDVKALDPVKTILPQLYSQIDKKLGVLETDKYYLMDSMKGYKDAE